MCFSLSKAKRIPPPPLPLLPLLLKLLDATRQFHEVRERDWLLLLYRSAIQHD
jgi:hypothetical protein